MSGDSSRRSLVTLAPTCSASISLLFSALPDGHPYGWFTQTSPIDSRKVDRARLNGTSGEKFMSREYYYQIDQEAGTFWSVGRQQRLDAPRPEPPAGGRAEKGGGDGQTSQPFAPAQLTQLDTLPVRSPLHNDCAAPAVHRRRYHDHSMGVTAMNVYAGLAGPLLIRDQRERALQISGVLPSGPYEVPLVLKDYWSVKWPQRRGLGCEAAGQQAQYRWRRLAGSATGAAALHSRWRARLFGCCFTLPTLAAAVAVDVRCCPLCAALLSIALWPCTGCAGFTPRPAASGISCSASTKCSEIIPSSTDR